MIRHFACLTIVLTPFLVLSAQQPPAAPTAPTLSFDVASIKPNRSGDPNGLVGPQPGGRISARNVQLATLVRFAYRLRTYQLTGGPSWVGTDRFDVEAKAGGNPTSEQMRAMLRTLLAERFQLILHSETREVDGFSLTKVNSNRLGPNLRRSTVDCSTSFSTESRCREGVFGVGHFRGVGMSTSLLAEVVAAAVVAPIIDKTELTGFFDVDLQWSPEMAPSADLPSIFTAVREQLGLELESMRVPSEVFVVDQAERPTPD